MGTLTACPACRTAVPPGMPACLRCGHAINEIALSCGACAGRNVSGARFCAACGHSLTAPPEEPVKPAEHDAVRGLFASRVSRVPLAMGLIFIVLLTAVGILKIVEHYFVQPERTVSAFFDALADRDVARIRFLVPAAAVRDQSLLGPRVLTSAGYTPPSAARVERIETEGDQATVQVSYEAGNQRYATTVSLRRDDHAEYGLFRQWHIVDGGLQYIRVEVQGPDAVLVAVTSIPLEEGGGNLELAAYPGAYRVSLPEQPLWEAAPAVAIADDEAAAVRLTPTIKSSARDAVNQQVRAYVDECAKSTVLSPEDCPFSAYAYSEVRNVRWRIVRYPAVDLEYDSASARVDVTTVAAGEVEVTGREVPAFGGGDSPYRDREEVSVSGAVTVSGNTVTYVSEDRD